MSQESQESLDLVPSGNIPEDTGPTRAAITLQIDDSISNAVSQVVRAENAPLHGQLRAMELTLKALVSQVGQNNERIKELVSLQAQEAEHPKKLLTPEGHVLFRKRLFENLQLDADTAEEKDLFGGLMQDLRINEHLVKDSAKSESDLLKGFRKNRSVMRQQIKRRVTNDLVKKDSDLKETVGYIGKHLGSLPEEAGLAMVFAAAYIMVKYLNELCEVTGKRQEDQRKAGEKALWDLAFRKLKVEPLTVPQLKLKLKNALAGGYKPL